MKRKIVHIIDDYIIDYSLFIGAIYLILFYPVIFVFIASIVLIPLMGYGMIKLTFNLQDQLRDATPEVKFILK